MDSGAQSYRRFLDGDDGGIVEIIKEYKDGLILFLNRYVNNIHIAEDLAEDTFFKLVTKKPKYINKHTFKTWLYTIGRNTAINYIKRASRTEPMSQESCFADEAALETEYLKHEQKITVHRAIALLKSDYGKVLYLKYFEDLSNDEISVIMKKNKRQVENMIYQAKRALKEHLEKEGFCYEEL